MQRTPNLGLPQFELSDKYRLEDYNEAYMKIDEKVKELKDKEAQLDTKLAEAQSIIDTWETFKNTGGEINGDIAIEKHLANLRIGDSFNIKTHDQNTELSSDWNKSIVLRVRSNATDSASHVRLNNVNFAGNGNMSLGEESTPWTNIYLKGVSKSQNGYTKLPNGMIMQWGENVSIMRGDESKTISFPITFPNHCLGTLSFIKEVVGYVPTKARIASDWNEHSQFRQTVTVFGDESVTVYTRFIAFGW